MNKHPLRFALLGIPFLLFWMTPQVTWAHRDDYIDETLVYLTLERHEVEPEYWFDFGHRSDRSLNFIRNNFALEFGITEHWMIDGRVTIVSEFGEGTDFESARLETRYRFLEEGTLPIDIALSAEINTEQSEEGSQEPGIEPRLILSRDFGKLNLTLNLPLEILLRSGSVDFIPSFGFRYNLSRLLRLGAEFHYQVKDRFGSAIPQIWFALPHEVTLKLGFSFGFDRNPIDFGRMAIEVGF
jgi:hypothetical protein